MEIETLIVVYILLWVIPCMIIAAAKNKNVGMAFLASLLFGIFALIYYIFVRSEPQKEEKSRFKCTDCGAEVSDSDKFCPECGAKFGEDKYIKCTKCKTHNKSNVKYCTKCGYKLAKEPKPAFICDYCNKKLRSGQELGMHKASCKEYKKARNGFITSVFWVSSFIVFVGLYAFFIIFYKILLIPLILVGFIITPFFDKLFNYIKGYFKFLKRFEINWWKKAIIISMIIILFIFIIKITPECPKSCNDNNPCTNDFCSSQTGYKCMNVLKLNCKGNGVCEYGEYGSSDCPNCDDGNKCTADSYDVNTKKCLNIEMIGCE